MWVFLLLVLWGVPGAFAQVQDRVLVGTLHAEAQRVLASDEQDALALPTREVPGGRVDARSGEWRVQFHLVGDAPRPALTPVEAARAFLREEAAAFGLHPALNDLLLVRHSPGAFDHSVVFQQTVGGIPVLGREIKLILDPQHRVRSVSSGYESRLRNALLAPPAEVRAEAFETLVAEGRLLERAETLVFPSDPPVMAHRGVVASDRLPVAWEVVLDARTQAPIYARPYGISKVRAALRPESRRVLARPFQALPTLLHAQQDGRGMVFDPTPLTTAGVTYGGLYQDFNDADTPELNAQRREVTLPRLSLVNGRYVLTGPFVDIIGTGSSVAYTPPSDPDGRFLFTRGQPDFEAVMSYYHIDKSQRRVQALNVGRPIMASPVRVHPRGLTSDASFFFPGENRIVFGTGGIDDGEDAGVIWHEYAHAILHSAEPSVFNLRDGRSLHEGWADYWTASYARGLQERGIGDANWRHVFNWDGNHPAIRWCGRWLDHPGFYNDVDRSRMRYTPPPGCSIGGNDYQWGVLWATTLMEVYDALGQDLTDRLVVHSLTLLATVPGVPAYEAAARALLLSDALLYDGAHRSALVRILANRGYLNAADYGPRIAHTGLRSTEQAGGTREVVAEVASDAALRSVTLFYRAGNGGMQSLAMPSTSPTTFAAHLPLPAGSAQVQYYIEAEDVQNRRTRWPEQAPTTPWTFFSGPDLLPPALTHTPPLSITATTWPPTLVAEAEDPLGIAALELDFVLRAADGSERSRGRLPFVRDAGPRFTATLPALPQGRVGDVLAYSIVATDSAAAANTARWPTSGTMEVPVRERGMVARFDPALAASGLSLDGVWERGVPTYGLRSARSGTAVWGTVLGGAYPEVEGTSILSLPPLDLRADSSWLVFWHWFDTERLDAQSPANDGGQVQASLDGGMTWQPLTPVGGYPATLAADAGVLRAGSPVFGGASRQWVRARIPLPVGPNVRLRFVFGTGVNNFAGSAFGYAGWFIDALEVTTETTPDATPPTLLAQPPETQYHPAGQPLPVLVVRATDNDGVAHVSAPYAVKREGIVLESGTVALQQSVEDPLRWTAAWPGATFQAPGTDLCLTPDVRDADGNRTAGSEACLKVRTLQETPLTRALQASGQWRDLGEVFALASPLEGAATSALRVPPLDLPSNPDVLHLTLTHIAVLPAPASGLVEASTDAGRTWQRLTPQAGYPTENGFSGSRLARSDVFDLAAFTGQTVWLRFVANLPQGLAFGDGWTIESVRLFQSTPEPTFDTPRTTRVHLPFPNPARDHLTLDVSLAEDQRVSLYVYDLLGRRVLTVRDDVFHTAGSHAFRADVRTLAPGAYFLRVRFGELSETRPFIVY